MGGLYKIMSNFINTIDTLGEEEVYKRIVERTIDALVDDSVTKVGESAFSFCETLTTVNFPNATSIGSSAFYNCSALTTVIIGTNQTTVVTLPAYAFASTPIASGTGYIYVPDNLVNSYKTATNWSTYATQIKGISELPAE